MSDGHKRSKLSSSQDRERAVRSARQAYRQRRSLPYGEEAPLAVEWRAQALPMDRPELAVLNHDVDPQDALTREHAHEEVPNIVPKDGPSQQFPIAMSVTFSCELSEVQPQFAVSSDGKGTEIVEARDNRPRLGVACFEDQFEGGTQSRLGRWAQADGRIPQDDERLCVIALYPRVHEL